LSVACTAYQHTTPMNGGKHLFYLRQSSSSALQLEWTKDKTQQQHVGVERIPQYTPWHDNPPLTPYLLVQNVIPGIKKKDAMSSGNQPRSTHSWFKASCHWHGGITFVNAFLRCNSLLQCFSLSVFSFSGVSHIHAMFSRWTRLQWRNFTEYLLLMIFNTASLSCSSFMCRCQFQKVAWVPREHGVSRHTTHLRKLSFQLQVENVQCLTACDSAMYGKQTVTRLFSDEDACSWPGSPWASSKIFTCVYTQLRLVQKKHDHNTSS